MLIGLAVGRITKDAELRLTKSGASLCSFTLACNSNYGEKKQTDFVKIALFGKRANSLNEYLTKGTALTVEGTAKSNSWISKSGEAKGEIEIVANKLTLQGKSVSNGTVSSDTGNSNTDSYVPADDIPF
jgi:single-strand DNA-binding protein